MRLNGFAASLAHALYPDDERWGNWNREELEQMNAAFVTAVERAFASGLESRASAAAQVKLPTNSARLSTPLCPATQEGLFRSAAPDTTVFVTRR